uniref:Uncharacterized protein n=1 Tax=Romanomermis culicivorax TaxID=13658 RepID=A0A915JV18_ROMCU
MKDKQSKNFRENLGIFVTTPYETCPTYEALVYRFLMSVWISSCWDKIGVKGKDVKKEKEEYEKAKMETTEENDEKETTTKGGDELRRLRRL